MTRKAPISHNKIELTWLLHRISLISLIVFVCASAFCGCVSADNAWDGHKLNWTWYDKSSTDYYIYDAESLAALAQKTSYNYTTYNFSGKTIHLMNDLDLGSKQWLPIGFIYKDSTSTDKKPFKGNFDGGGHTISNLYINKPSNDYRGLFGYAEYANFTNVTLTNVSITANNYVGGLIGYNYKGKGGSSTIIENCNVTTGYVSGNDHVGGLIGYDYRRLIGVEFMTTIKNCYAAVNVSGNNYVGGLIGEDKHDDYVNGFMTIKNCYAAGDVSGNNYVGGIIGHFTYISDSSVSSSIIENCYAAGDVNGADYVGGLIGANYFTRNASLIYVNNSTALNKYVNGTSSHVGRITGGVKNDNKKVSLNYNYGWEGMKNGDNFFTDNIGLSQINGENVSSIQVWCNESFFKDTLHWDFVDTWDMAITSIENDDGISYPLPYITSLGKNDSLRAKVLYLKPVNVTFNPNEGTGLMYDQVFTKGVPQYLYQNKYTRTGYKFIGWNNTYPDGTDVNFIDKQQIRVTKDTTLYAVWAKITNVTLYFNNTTSSTSGSQVVNITNGFDEFNVTQLARPIYKGYTFLGYNNSSKGGGVQVINDTLKLVQNAEGYTLNGKWNNTSENVELYAVWKANTTQIKLHFNNSTDKSETVAIDYNSTEFNLTSHPSPIHPEWKGHTFLGYNSTKDGGVQVIGSDLKLLKGVSGYTDESGQWNNDSSTINLWAVWKANTTQITLHFNNSTDKSENVAIDYNSTEFNLTSHSSPTYPEWKGHTFLGYNSTEFGGVQVIGSDLKLLKGVSGYTDESGQWNNDTLDVHLWAVWEKLYDIKLIQTEGGKIYASNSSAVSGSEITLTAAPEYDYAFAGWTVKNESKNPSGEIVDANGKFIMPEYSVVVTAKFTHIKQYETGGDDSDSWVYPKPTANTTPTITPTPTIKPTVTPTLNPVEPTEEQPTAAPTQSPMPVLGLLAGIAAALLIRRK